MLSQSHLCCQLHNSPLNLRSELGRGVLPLLELSVLVVARFGHQTLLVDGALHLPLLLLLDLLHPDQGHVTCYMVTTNVFILTWQIWNGWGARWWDWGSTGHQRGLSLQQSGLLQSFLLRLIFSKDSQDEIVCNFDKFTENEIKISNYCRFWFALVKIE